MGSSCALLPGDPGGRAILEGTLHSHTRSGGRQAGTVPATLLAEKTEQSVQLLCVWFPKYFPGEGSEEGSDQQVSNFTPAGAHQEAYLKLSDQSVRKQPSA